MNDISVMINDIHFNYRVCLLIIKNHRLYLEHVVDADAYTLPGGRVKTCEYSDDALIREIKEEMGITIPKTNLVLNTITENFFTLNNINHHEICFVYRLVIDDKIDSIISKELVDHRKNLDDDKNCYYWFNIDDLHNVNLLPSEYKKIDVSKEFATLKINNLNK